MSASVLMQTLLSETRDMLGSDPALSELVGIKAGSNYGPDYAAAFDAAYADLAETHDVPLYPDFFAPLQADGEGVEAARRAYLQADGLHPNADGVARIVEEIGPLVRDLAESARAE